MSTTYKNPPVFEGLPSEALLPLLDQLKQRRFPAGARVIAEGDFLGEMYIVVAGVAEVFMSDSDGVEHLVNRVGTGGTLGEIALITGQAHSASVRASTELDVLVLDDADLRDAATAFPELYRNLVGILSRRLVRSNRRAFGAPLGRVTLLIDDDAPPVLGYALASSVAWHAQCSTLLLRIDDRPPAAELMELASAAEAHAMDDPRLTFGGGHARTQDGVRPRAVISLTPPTGAFAPGALAATLDHLTSQYEQVLVQVPPDFVSVLNVGRRFYLTGSVNAAVRDGSTVIRAWSERASSRPDRDGILHIPALEPIDEQGLRAGLLTARGQAGEALGWAARHLTGLKVGIALGAGSVRGYAHVGVLRVFDRIKLPVDYIAGTSIGAAVAALHALGRQPTEIAISLTAAGNAAFRLTLPTRGMLSSAALQKQLRAIGGDTRIEDVPIPLALTATDLATRREVVFRTGLLWPAVLASLTIPGVYPAQVMGEYMLVDGGLSNPVPASVAAAMGADVVIAVKLLGHTIRGPQYIEAVEPRGAPPGVLEVMMRSFEIVQSHVPANAPDVATVVVAPEFDASRGLGLRNFRDGMRFIEIGERAAEASMPRLAAALPWLRT
jgi:NTE family protein